MVELKFSLIVSLMVGAYVGVSETATVDAEGLLAFRAIADVGGRLEGVWNRSDCCHWEGVKECRNGRLTKLVVENLRLNGTFAPDTLSRLDQLRVLSLKGNGLRGPIPDLSLLHNLKNLFLNYNNFTGSFPISIAGLHRLRVIILSHNSLGGEIPVALASLPRLSVLSLENNQFSGTLAAFNQSSLTFFNVSDNELSGPVPDTLALSAFDLPSFNGNPGLCGRIIHKPCALLPPINGPHNQAFLPVIEKNNKSRKHGNRAKIAIIVVGSIVGLSTILCVVILFICKERHRPSDEQTAIGGKQNGDEEGYVAGESDAQQSSKSKSRSPQSGGSCGSGNLVFCGGETQIYSLEDLLKATAVILGRGSLGSSYRVAMESGVTVVVKRLKNCNAMNMSRGEFETHMEMLGILRHPNMVSLRAYFRAKEESLLVYDYYPNGNLFSLIHGTESQSQSSEGEAQVQALHWTSCLKITEDIGQGVAYLHRMGLIHGNLKSSNVLIGFDFEACITDYGLTLFGYDSDNCDSTPTITAYRAPECNYTCKMTSMADVYSFGVILLEILSGKTATQLVMNMWDLPRWVKSVRVEEGGGESGSVKVQALLNIAMACVSPSPELRPSMTDVVRMIRESSETSATASEHSPTRWSDSLPRDRRMDPASFTERERD